MQQSKPLYFSEQELLFKERTGKDFNFFYKKYYNKLTYFTTTLCKDSQRAEDLSTEAFLIAFNKINMYENTKSQFSTWLFTIARNLTLQEMKIDKRTVSIDTSVDDEGTTMKDFIPELESNEVLYDEIWDKKSKIMKQCISELKDPYKKVIEMREIKKMSYNDISKELDKNLSTIKSQIRNGRSILMRETKKEFDLIDKMYF